jgi:hypothetical protein
MALCFLLAGAAGAVSDRFLSDCKTLTHNEHRLSGTPEYRAAADYVMRRLTEIGVDDVVEQQYGATQTSIVRCDLKVMLDTDSAVARAIYPLRPNGIMPPVTAPEGITAELVHVHGTGERIQWPAEVYGKIAVIDFNAQLAWYEAFRMGAKAVILVADSSMRSNRQHAVPVEANMPRFFYAGSREDLPEGATAMLHSNITWTPAIGRNIAAVIRGTDPVFDTQRPEMIVVGANLDTYGEAPRLSPGARGAANCAGLLKIAETLVRRRPRRDIMLVFFDGQARCHQGSSNFYRVMDTLTAKFKNARVSNRLHSLDLEEEFGQDLLTVAQKRDPFDIESDKIKKVYLRMLKTNADDKTYMALEQKRIAGEARLKANKNSEAYERQTQRLERANTVWRQWNDLRRALDKESVHDSLTDKLDELRGEIRQKVLRRVTELENERAFVQSDARLGELKADRWITFHLSMLIGDHGQRWGIVAGGESELYDGDPNAYERLYSGLQKVYETDHGEFPDFEPATVSGLISPRDFWSAPLVHPGEVAERLGIYNVAAGTIQETIPFEGTPDDRLENLNLDMIERQVEQVARFLIACGNSPHAAAVRSIDPDRMYWYPSWKENGVADGPHVIANAPGSPYKNRYVSGMTIRLDVSPQNQLYKFIDVVQPPAFDNFQVIRTNANGYYSFGPVTMKQKDPKQNQKAFGIKFDSLGMPAVFTDNDKEKEPYQRLAATPCGSMGGCILPPTFLQSDISLYDAEGNSAVQKDEKYVETKGGVGFWIISMKTELFKLFSGSEKVTPAIVTLNNGPRIDNFDQRPDKPYGVGFKADKQWDHIATAQQSGGDLWRLNEERLRVLRSGGIIKSSLERLHSNAKELLLRAKEASDAFMADAFAAAGFLAEGPIYSRVKNTMNDLVVSVMFLLIVSLPFGFALERLVINAKTVYGRIGGFALFFVITFLILYMTHPAFALSAMPLIIFLGFTIIVMSGMVISILAQKFEAELKAMQGMSSSLHSADVSRAGTVLAAMSMGISSMRRRPLRTALTAMTTVLLTFTILCFASFEFSPGIDRSFLGAPRGYAASMFRKTYSDQLDPSLVSALTKRFAGRAKTCVRYWRPRAQNAEVGASNKKRILDRVPISNAEMTRHFSLEAMLGIDPRELVHRRDLRELLDVSPEQFENMAFITAPIAQRLGVQAGDTVSLDGKRVVLGKILESSDMAAVTDLDERDIYPLGVKVQPDINIEELTTVILHIGGDNQVVLPVSSTVIVPADVARQTGATGRVVLVYPDDPDETKAISEELAQMMPFDVFGTENDGVYRYRLAQQASARGVGDLVLPIILGGLVILGTMLGSVTDREKEIYTFSALGLAPAHVASLFFIEAMVYAVIGGMGGYIVAQGFSAVLGIFSHYGIVAAPEINYSSTNSIVTMLIVMAVVLLSAVYPAIKASKSANPGIMRAWKMPKPEGDRFSILFPFTVSSYDITGVVSFLREHFERFSDTSLGVFMAKEAEIFMREDSLGVKAHIALAPFDLGVTQDFELYSEPSEIEGIDEVRINIQRRSGLNSDWERLNKNLLHDLRKQLLIWRSLPKETMEHYRSMTLDTLHESREHLDRKGQAGKSRQSSLASEDA